MLTLEEFEKTFNRLFTPLCLFALKYVNDKNLAKDIVHDVFLKVWENKSLIKNKSNIDGFFYSSVRNMAIDFLRSKYAKDFKSYPDEELDFLQNDSDFIRETIVLDAAAIVQNAINLLPDKAAEVIRLHLEGKSNIDIAEDLGITINTVKTYKQRAYQRFRELLGGLTFS